MSEQPREEQGGWLPALPVILGLACLAIWSIRYFGSLRDDVLVTARCAANLAAGAGVSFNLDAPGPWCRDILGTVASGTLANWLGSPLDALRVLSLLGPFVAVFAVFQLSRVAGRAVGTSANAALLLTLTLPGFGYWSIVPGGDAWSAPLLAMGAASAIGNWRLGPLSLATPCLLALAIERPALAATFVPAILAVRRNSGRSIVADVVSFITLWSAFLVWRWAGSGTPLIGLVDSFTSVRAGLEQLDAFARAYPFLAGMLAFPLLKSRALTAVSESGVGTLSTLHAMAIVGVAGVVLEASPLHVFHGSLVAVLPLLAVLLAMLPGVLRLSPQVLLVLALVQGVWSVATSDDSRAQALADSVRKASAVGEWAHANLAPKETVLTDVPGTIAYFSEHTVYPMSGLPGGRGFAAAGYDASLRLRPDLILFEDSLTSHNPKSDAERRLYDDVLFRFFYVSGTRDVAGDGASVSRIHTFEFDETETALWDKAWATRHDDDALISFALETWKGLPREVGSGDRRVEVEAKVDRVLALITEGKRADAEALLRSVRAENRLGRSAAAARNASAAAAQLGDLTLAAAHARDRMRYDPEDFLGPRDLRITLRVPVAMIGGSGGSPVADQPANHPE